MRQRERQTEGVGGGEEEELLREREEKRLRHVDPPPSLACTSSPIGECENRSQPVPGSYTYTGVLTALPHTPPPRLAAPPQPPTHLKWGGGRKISKNDWPWMPLGTAYGHVPNTVQTYADARPPAHIPTRPAWNR